MTNLFIKTIFILCFVALSLSAQTQEVTTANIKEMEQKANQGNVNAQYLVGIYYLRQIVPVTDETIAKARKYLRKAAEQGHEYAQDQYACFFEWEKNYKTALIWFQKAAKQGNGDALQTIGRYYMEGLGVKRDLKKALEYYLKSAQKGYDIAMLWLGNFYSYGINNILDRDVFEAFKWYEKAAELGNTDAMVHMAECYIEGNGCLVDLSKAYSWFSKAIKLGCKEYQKDLMRWRTFANDGNKKYKEFINYYDKQS